MYGEYCLFYHIISIKKYIKSNVCAGGYVAPAAEACEAVCSELLCQSPQINQEEFGGFTPYDPWN